MTFRTLLTRALGLFFGFIFPAYGSINAIESPSSGDDTQWLVYWLIFSLLTITENVLWPLLKWIPLYQELKIALLAWLVLPQTKGAEFVFERILQPGWSFVNRELSKNPAFERVLARTGTASSGFGSENLSVEQQQAVIEKRRTSLAQSVMAVSTKLEDQLKRISEVSDPSERRRAENKFDKELSRLSKIGADRGSNPFGKLA